VAHDVCVVIVIPFILTVVGIPLSAWLRVLCTFTILCLVMKVAQDYLVEWLKWSEVCTRLKYYKEFGYVIFQKKLGYCICKQIARHRRFEMPSVIRS